MYKVFVTGAEVSHGSDFYGGAEVSIGPMRLNGFWRYGGNCTALAESANSSKSRLDNHWRNQHIIYNLSL